MANNVIHTHTETTHTLTSRPFFSPFIFAVCCFFLPQFQSLNWHFSFSMPLLLIESCETWIDPKHPCCKRSSANQSKKKKRKSKVVCFHYVESDCRMWWMYSWSGLSFPLWTMHAFWIGTRFSSGELACAILLKTGYSTSLKYFVACNKSFQKSASWIPLFMLILSSTIAPAIAHTAELQIRLKDLSMYMVLPHKVGSQRSVKLEISLYRYKFLNEKHCLPP